MRNCPNCGHVLEPKKRTGHQGGKSKSGWYYKKRRMEKGIVGPKRPPKKRGRKTLREFAEAMGWTDEDSINN